MVDNKKAARFSPAASKNKHSISNYNVHAVLKNVIVRLGFLGVIPASLAQWLIQRGGLANA